MRIDKSQVLAHVTYINVLHLSFLICIFLGLLTQKLHAIIPQERGITMLQDECLILLHQVARYRLQAMP